MYIKKLILKNYRNYDNLELKFNQNLNIIIGNNAQGKTNILESIYLLGITRSFLTTNDKNLIKMGCNNCKVKASVLVMNRSKNLEVIISEIGKKVKIDNKEVSKFSDYVAKFNIVIFGPHDLKLIKDIPNVRRHFLDVELSQLDTMYLRKIKEFNIVLKNRNEYLKYVKLGGKCNLNYLDIINEKYASLCVYIYFKRKEFIDKINKYIADIYEKTGNYKGLNLRYSSNVFLEYDNEDDLKAKFLKKINDNINKEINYGSSILGVRRDDFSFYLGDKNLINYGSQGQQKLAILSLKLAEIGIFKVVKGENPILLLDDLFGELDIKKRNSVIRYISNDIQTIITTTDVNRIDKKLVSNSKIFKISNGKVEEEKK